LATILFALKFTQAKETVEIFVEADFETLPEQHRRFATINVPRQLFSQEAARRATKKAR
jgi:hypothetical protein